MAGTNYFANYQDSRDSADKRKDNAVQADRMAKQDADAEKTKQKKERIDTETNAYRKASEAGNKEEMAAHREEIHSLDPNYGALLDKTVAEKGAAEASKLNDYVGNSAYGISNSKDKIAAYGEFYKSAPPDAQKRLPSPEDFAQSPDKLDGWLNLSMAKAAKADVYLKSIADQKSKSGDEGRKASESNALVKQRLSATELNIANTNRVRGEKTKGSEEGKLTDQQRARVDLLKNTIQNSYDEEERQAAQTEFDQLTKPKNKPGSPIDLDRKTSTGVSWKVVQ